MIFLTTADLLTKIDQETLDYISQGDANNIDLCEDEAIDEMIGYLNVRYDTDLIFTQTGTDRSAQIIMRCTDITLYHLHTSASPDNVPELREKRYNDAIGWLEKIADGFINPILPAKETEPTTPLRSGNSKDKEDFYF